MKNKLESTFKRYSDKFNKLNPKVQAIISVIGLLAAVFAVAVVFPTTGESGLPSLLGKNGNDISDLSSSLPSLLAINRDSEPSLATFLCGYMNEQNWDNITMIGNVLKIRNYTLESGENVTVKPMTESEARCWTDDSYGYDCLCVIPTGV